MGADLSHIQSKKMVYKRYKKRLQRSKEAIALVSARAEFLDLNDAFVNLFRYDSKAPFLGLSFAKMSPEVQPNKVLSKGMFAFMVKEALDSNTGKHDFAWTYVRRDGSTFPAHVWITVMTLLEKVCLQIVVVDASGEEDAMNVPCSDKELLKSRCIIDEDDEEEKQKKEVVQAPTAATAVAEVAAEAAKPEGKAAPPASSFAKAFGLEAGGAERPAEIPEVRSAAAEAAQVPVVPVVAGGEDFFGIMEDLRKNCVDSGDSDFMQRILPLISRAMIAHDGLVDAQGKEVMALKKKAEDDARERKKAQDDFDKAIQKAREGQQKYDNLVSLCEGLYDALGDVLSYKKKQDKDPNVAPTPVPAPAPVPVVVEPAVKPVAAVVPEPVEPVKAVVEPVKAVVEPVKVVAEPVKAVVEPAPAAVPVPEEVKKVPVVAEPVKAVAEPVKAVAEPVKAVAEPVKAAAEPTPAAVPEPVVAVVERAEPVEVVKGAIEIVDNVAVHEVPEVLTAKVEVAKVEVAKVEVVETPAPVIEATPMRAEIVTDYDKPTLGEPMRAQIEGSVSDAPVESKKLDDEVRRSTQPRRPGPPLEKRQSAVMARARRFDGTPAKEERPPAPKPKRGVADLVHKFGT